MTFICIVIEIEKLKFTQDSRKTDIGQKNGTQNVSMHTNYIYMCVCFYVNHFGFYSLVHII